jgi:hypothetical protein
LALEQYHVIIAVIGETIIHTAAGVGILWGLHRLKGFASGFHLSWWSDDVICHLLPECRNGLMDNNL